MQLAEFIKKHHEAILRDWETFARSLRPAADGLSKAGLRDHADEILTAIVRNMGQRQSAAEQSSKSKGHETNGNKAAGQLGALGELHAVLRVESGFTLTQVVAEYRALRASVFRLWVKTRPDPEGVLRFNEAIDQALAEAVDQYTEKTTRYRDQLIAIVSHDLRNPLSGILLGSATLSRSEELDDKNARLASRIQSSAKRMLRIVDDLLDLTRTRLGSQIPIVRSPTDAGPICEMVIAELEGSHPHAVIRYTSKGDLRGHWDHDRLAQVMSNLVGNALQHGATDKPISVIAQGDDAEIALAVNNAGPRIPESAQSDIFEPMVRHVTHASKASNGLGLGLYIANQVVTAHGGTIAVASTDENGTTFTVRLPRHQPGPPPGNASARPRATRVAA